MFTVEERAKEHADRCAEARHHHRGGALGAYCEQDFRAGWEAAVETGVTATEVDELTALAQEIEAAPPVAPAPPVSLGDLWRKCQAELNNPRSSRSQDAIVRSLAEEAFAAGFVEAASMKQSVGNLPREGFIVRRLDTGERAAWFPSAAEARAYGEWRHKENYIVDSAGFGAEVEKALAELDSITLRLRELVSRYSSATLKSDDLTAEGCLEHLDDLLCNMVADLDSNEATGEVDPEDPSLRDGDDDLEEELPEGAVFVPDELRSELAAFCSERAGYAIRLGGPLRETGLTWTRLSLALLGEE